jgi:hypothetical protein
MKRVLCSILLCSGISLNALAKPQATKAMEDLLPAGQYFGQSGAAPCSVTVEIANNTLSVLIDSDRGSAHMTVADQNTAYNVNQVTGALNAQMNLKFPHFINGGIRQLYVTSKVKSSVDVSISDILFDHKGNDNTSVQHCRVRK